MTRPDAVMVKYRVMYQKSQYLGPYTSDKTKHIVLQAKQYIMYH